MPITCPLQTAILVDEHNYYITPAYSDEGWYVEKTTFAE